MKRTTNKYQEHYMTAKAAVEVIEARQNEIERQYIAEKNIKNPDGSTPEFIYCMEDDAAFEIANEECSAIIVASGLEAELNAARAVLKTAENNLIAYGLSIAPAGIRATLQEAAKKNAATRMKIIDLVFKLDVSTVRA